MSSFTSSASPNSSDPISSPEEAVRRLQALTRAMASFSAPNDRGAIQASIAQAGGLVRSQARCLALLWDEASRYLSSLDDRWEPGPEDRSWLLAIAAPSVQPQHSLPPGLRRMVVGGPDSEPEGQVLLAPLRLDAEGSLPLGWLMLALPGNAPPFTSLELDMAGLLASNAATALLHIPPASTVNAQLFETVARGKQEWEQIFDAISDGVFICNTDRVVIRANQAFAATFGMHPREVVGRRCHQIVWGRSSPCQQCILAGKDRYHNHLPAASSIECTVEGRSSEITTYPVINDQGNISAIVHIVKDITEQKRMQELIIRSEKLSAIGEMASGVAHDFNNLLSSIIGWSDVMLASELTPRLRECAQAVHQAAMDGAETVKRIQEYTRIRKDTEFGSVDLNEVVQGAIDLARPRWKDAPERSGVTINLYTDLADIPPARGTASDLREVLLNIIINATHALENATHAREKGGDIHIRTGQEGERVYASVQDNGIGMTEEIRKRIFDPYFTTKGPAGSGLGLSVAYGIVSRHGGEITVESTPGQGSIFTVYLPAAPATTRPIGSLSIPPAQPACILLIDDDRRVLRAIEALLQQDGHTVSPFANPRKAIAAFQEQLFDLVITDLGMPEVNGWEVAATVKQISPNTPVVLLTGWGAEIATGHLEESGVDAILQKPCRLAPLRQAINQVRCQPLPAPPTNPLPTEVPAGSVRILVVEDNKLLGAAMVQRLEIDGYEAVLAPTGREALAQLSGSRGFHLVLVDLNLPDMPGAEIARAAAAGAPRPMVAIMSGDITALDSTIVREAGADAVLSKPWKESELQALISAAGEAARG